ncbi:hypothetical protein MAPG_08567 [Magnaporthiopsis poae ATCC 64411]|uniref:Uncharacterized protein n=1 Tax=Magnaporthiopsis poae (strain ATCC 64411 / 73-15) TaxID=644358 RepID=A0A0C4E7P8_MAGP6|nr:hypothetical protein MAPG_08567 [Magnaporthiopsis poae ATCC 64411]
MYLSACRDHPLPTAHVPVRCSGLNFCPTMPLLALTCAHRSHHRGQVDGYKNWPWCRHVLIRGASPEFPHRKQTTQTQPANMGLTQDFSVSTIGFFPAPETTRSLPQFTTMVVSSTQYATPMGRGAYDTTGVSTVTSTGCPKPPAPKPR